MQFKRSIVFLIMSAIALCTLQTSCVENSTNINSSHNVRMAERYFEDGCDYVLKGNNEASLKAFEKATQLNPNHVLAFYMAANRLYILNRYDLACVYARRSLEIDPNYVNSRALLSYILFAQNKYVECLEETNKLIVYYPNSELYKNRCSAYFILGVCYAKNKQYANSAEYFRKYLAEAPSKKEPQKVIANAKSLLSNVEGYLASEKKIKEKNVVNKDINPKEKVAAPTNKAAAPQAIAKPAVDNKEEENLQGKIDDAIGRWSREYKALGS